MNAAVQWISDHDDRWSFILLYVGGAIALSIYAGLFWVCMLMLMHFSLELAKQIIIKTDRPLFHALWEIKLDISLFLFALVIVLYSDAVMAALGLGHAARAGQAARAVRGAQVFTRFGIIQRSLRVLLLIIDDLMKFALAIWKGFHRKKNGQSTQQPTYKSLEEAKSKSCALPPWKKMGKGDYFSLGFGILCLSLLLFAPALTGVSSAQAIEAVFTELKP